MRCLRMLRLGLLVMAVAAFLVCLGLHYDALPQTALAAEAASPLPPTLAAGTPEPGRVAPVITADTAAVRGALIPLAQVQTVLELIYQAVNPSVVSIWGMAPMEQAVPSDSPQVPQRMPLKPSRFAGALWPQLALGSGFVWDDAGHIVTNNHVVSGAEHIHVTFASGLTVPATIVGQDELTDLAVLKVEATSAKLQPVLMGDSTTVRVGQFAVAIGNPFGYEGTMTFGIVSAVGRYIPVVREGTPMGGPVEIIPDIIQTDAPINPGSSGGVLTDLQGRVIGVTSDGAAGLRWSTGVGFAIPSVIVQRVVPALIEDGVYTPPWLGANLLTLLPEFAEAMGLPATQQGALVIDVNTDSPADKAGVHGSSKRVTIEGEDWLIGGDVITAIDSQPVRRSEDIETYLARHVDVGDNVELTLVRDNDVMTLAVVAGIRPEPTEEDAATPEPVGTAWIGVDGVALDADVARAMQLPAQQAGVLVQSVVAGSPADKAGLRGGYQAYPTESGYLMLGGDVIVKAGGQAVKSLEDLNAVLAKSSPGDELILVVLRAGKELELSAILASPPEKTM